MFFPRRSARLWPRRWFHAFAGLGVGLSFTASLFALNPLSPANGYNVQVLQAENGLPSNKVRAVLQSHDGYLWLATVQGVARFDGVRFDTFDTSVRTNASAANFYDAVETPDETLWFGSAAGLFHWTGKRFEGLGAAEGLASNYVHCVAVARDSSLVVGTDKGISFISGGRITTPVGIWREIKGVIRAFHDCADGSRLVASESGLWRIRGEQIEKLSNTHALPEVAYTCILETPDGRVWLGSEAGLFCLRPDGSTIGFGAAAGLANSQVRCIRFDRNENLWIGTNGGLYRMRDDRIQFCSYPDEIGISPVTQICEDREGALWVSSDIGLFRLTDSPVSAVGPKEGVDQVGITTVCEAHDGTWWFGTLGGGLFHYDPETKTVTRLKGRFPKLGEIFSLYEDEKGVIWIGTNLGLFRYIEGKITEFAVDGESVERKQPGEVLTKIGRTRVNCIISDGASGLWIAARGALYHFHQGRLDPATTENGLPGNFIRSVLRTHDGDIWVTTPPDFFAGTARQKNFIARLHEGKWTLFDNSPDLVGDLARTLYEDPSGVVWVTTVGAGLSRFKDGRWRSYRTDQGLLDNFVASVVEDNHGVLWIGTSHGVMSVARQAFDDLDAGRIQTLPSRTYARKGGMPDSDCSEPGFPNAFKTHTGRLLFPTYRALTIIDPASVVANPLAPQVHIKRATMRGAEVDVSTASQVPPGGRDIAIYFTATSLLSPERVRFKIQLAPLDTGWVNVGTRRDVSYSVLPAGDYTFRVIACNDEGVWNEQGASWAFTVKPHFYETYWFWGASGFALGAAVMGFFRMRTREIRRRASALQSHNEELQSHITERRRAEGALRESEERYRRFFEEDLAGAFMATSQGRIIACNSTFARIFGFKDPTEAAGFDLASLWFEPSSWTALSERLRTSHRIRYNEQKMRHRSGAAVHVFANLIANFDSQNEPIEVTGYVLDTTERKNLEDQLRQVQKMDAIGQLAGGVAHDFNNLLTVIVSFAELVLEDAALSVETRVALTEIRNSGKRGAALTGQLLAFSRKQIIQPTLLNLNDVASDMERMLRRLIGDNVRLSMEFGANLGTVKADRGQMEQILLNLAINSRDAMADGGHLTIKTANIDFDETHASGIIGIESGTYVMFAVSDTGCGMPPDVQTHIFEPFFSTKGPGKGTGLGLSTVYGIVKQNNGYISFQSKPGAGTTFWIYLPRVDSSQKEISDEPPSSKGMFEGKTTILVLEDNEAVQRVALQILREKGYDVLGAKDGAEAMKILSTRGEEVDLVLTDFMLPDTNGLEFAGQVKKLYPQIGVLLTSGYADAMSGHGKLEEGMMILEKPFTPRSLILKIKEALLAKRK